ncbi:MAG: FixH family protein [Planctomycetes bacterium]|nr:FixH family protein [Planctomycetota bacterium]
MKLKWQYVVVGMLAIHSSAWVCFVFVAADDPTFAVEPNYYKKSMAWDDSALQSKKNLELGWKVNMKIIEDAVTKTHVMELSLDDDKAKPVSLARVHVEYFHHAHGQERLRCELNEGEAHQKGRYYASLRLPYEGMWEYRFKIEARGEVLTHKELQYLVKESQ